MILVLGLTAESKGNSTEMDDLSVMQLSNTQQAAFKNLLSGSH